MPRAAAFMTRHDSLLLGLVSHGRLAGDLAKAAGWLDQDIQRSDGCSAGLVSNLTAGIGSRGTPRTAPPPGDNAAAQRLQRLQIWLPPSCRALLADVQRVSSLPSSEVTVRALSVDTGYAAEDRDYAAKVGRVQQLMAIVADFYQGAR